MRLRELRHNLWNLGFIEEALVDTLEDKTPKIHWVKKRFKDRWFADPFILDVTESDIIILAEEYCYDTRKGRIARVVIDRKSYEEKEYDIILELPTHLSFPFILRKDGEVYLLPENSASGSSTIYKYNDANKEAIPLHQIANEPFTDATIVDIEGRTYLFTTISPDSNSNTVRIFSFDKDKLRVDKELASCNFSIKCGRNAGEVFEVNNQLYRPAQDCTLRYGHGVILQRISYDVGGNIWTFDNVNSFYPTTFRYNQGVHTFNNYKGLIVIDARGYRNPIIGRLLSFIFNIIGKR